MSSKQIDSPAKSDVHYDRMNELEPIDRVERVKSDEPIPESKRKSR